ncbi:MAG: DUF1146 domain-containing protein [Acholeplasmataceae bacterium]|jgi:uncharacterized membrane protein YwzB|nr:DUF1146 domain-containing protein [Acholeplasmataceae bacterium]
MGDYFYFGGLIIGFMWTFSSLQSTNLSSLFKKGHVWQIRSIYTILSLLGGHVVGVIFERIFLMLTGVFSL